MQFKAPAKVNIFLKITGIRGGYHELRSRFVRVESLYDTLTFVKKRRPSPGFKLASSHPLPQVNTLTKAYDLLQKAAPGIETFFEEHKLVLTKRIPQGAGLGGGSSDAATFLLAANELCGLHMSRENLAKIGECIGADVPFFVFGYPSANVEGIGEKIEPFEEEVPELKLFTPPLHCDTGMVYRTFRENFIETVRPENGREWLWKRSEEILKEVKPEDANDLYRAALLIYPRLRQYGEPGYFFSGSGSTFFAPEETSNAFALG
ncbi:4-(cytidine 5'-diphospho)-2-C-methyl-D-erythritol kinase [Hydrogenimonas sp. SS33]|uniref:4-(cytidine 5'-diphospho)-2-C-methyl-D-erythritol kinase n=1 Tax=Hydrogenimonas leucolamina TaxID=2954236 RepID=UPI00336C0FD5